MKELSIEQKARAYDEAYKVAEGIHRFSSNIAEIKRMEQLFPELKESDDERIRKEILEYFKQFENEELRGVNISDWITWLEKQGDKDKLIQELGEYKVKYTQEVLEKCMNNKDDERLRKTTIDFLKEFANKGYENAVECIDWLKKQNQQKPVESQSEKELTESYLAVFDKKYPILPTLKGKQLADFKNFLNKCQQEFGLKNHGLHPTQAKLFEKLALLWATWGAEHLQGIGKSEIEDTSAK